MKNNLSENLEILSRHLDNYGYPTKKLKLLGSGSEGSV
jgi:hypothetical protein